MLRKKLFVFIECVKISAKVCIPVLSLNLSLAFRNTSHNIKLTEMSNVFNWTIFGSVWWRISLYSLRNTPRPKMINIWNKLKHKCYWKCSNLSINLSASSWPQRAAALTWIKNWMFLNHFSNLFISPFQRKKDILTAFWEIF